MQGFVQVDWQEPLALDAIRAEIDPGNQVRGVFFGSAVSLVKDKTGQTPGRASYSALRNYPSTELLEVLVESAQVVFPALPLRQGLRQIGQRVFPRLLEIPAATFLFSVAGRDARKILGLVGRAYGLLSRGVSANYREQDGAVIVELRNIALFPDCYHYGIFEGALQHYATNAEMLVRRHNLRDVDILIRLAAN